MTRPTGRHPVVVHRRARAEDRSRCSRPSVLLCGDEPDATPLGCGHAPTVAHAWSWAGLNLHSWPELAGRRMAAPERMRPETCRSFGFSDWPVSTQPRYPRRCPAVPEADIGTFAPSMALRQTRSDWLGSLHSGRRHNASSVT
jgi:hypothetical protein